MTKSKETIDKEEFKENEKNLPTGSGMIEVTQEELKEATTRTENRKRDYDKPTIRSRKE